MCCGCKGKELEFCAECLELNSVKEGMCPELKRKLKNRGKAGKIGFHASMPVKSTVKKEQEV